MGTTRLPPDFKEFLKLLATHEVRYLLVGGYAVNAFGYVRNTVDIDFWIASDEQNQQRVIAVLREFAFPSATLALLAEPDAMLRMGVPPLRIELMKQISGVDFQSCWDRRVTVEMDGLQIPMISLDDLKKNKRASARPKDMADLAELP
jgi:predicted nucleotidyltransferase